MVRFGNARLGDDFACVDMAGGQIRQFVNPGKSSLKKKKKEKKR